MDGSKIDIPRVEDKPEEVQDDLENDSENKQKEKKEIDFHTAEENYYYHARLHCPQTLHRNNITHTNRLLGFADAMMATCGTFLVIPLRNLKHMEKGESFKDAFSKSDDLFMFNFGLLIILTIWGHINRENVVFRQADGLFILSTILIMWLTSLVPFSLKLMSYFRLHHQSFENLVFFFCGTLISIYVVEFMKIVYSFWSKKLLHFSIQNYRKERLDSIRNYLFVKPVFNILYCIITMLCSLLGYSWVAWILVGTMLLIPLMLRGMYYLHLKVTKDSFYETDPVLIRFREGNIDKERIEALTDAAVAIIALVLVIDITAEEDFHEVAEEMEKHGVGYTIVHSRHVLKFLACYVLTSIHWYLNHTVLHFFHKCDVVTMVLQMCFLLSLCYFPLLTEMLLKCWSMKTADIRFAFGLTAGIVLCCSLTNLFMFLRGLYLKDKALHKWLLSSGHMIYNMRKNIYLILKLSCIPVCSFILGLSTITDSTDHLSAVLWVCFLLPIVMLAGIKLLFLHKKISVAPNLDGPNSLTTRATVISFPTNDNVNSSFDDSEGQILPQAAQSIDIFQ